MFDAVCTASVARTGIADEPAAYEWSPRGMRQAVKCEGKDVSVHRGLLFLM